MLCKIPRMFCNFYQFWINIRRPVHANPTCLTYNSQYESMNQLMRSPLEFNIVQCKQYANPHFSPPQHVARHGSQDILQILGWNFGHLQKASEYSLKGFFRSLTCTCKGKIANAAEKHKFLDKQFANRFLETFAEPVLAILTCNL